MNCRSCQHARQAGNTEMIGCHYWTAIYHGDKNMLTSALKEIIKRKDLTTDLNNNSCTHDCMGGFIQILISEYAPKPIFEGWVALEKPYNDMDITGEMTNYCVVLDPKRLCTFYSQQTELSQYENRITNL